jgi:hypothetical protein
MIKSTDNPPYITVQGNRCVVRMAWDRQQDTYLVAEVLAKVDSAFDPMRAGAYLCAEEWADKLGLEVRL